MPQPPESPLPEPPQPDRPQPDRPPSWAGAPGFSPHHGPGVPHAPMPGAPPYPAAPPPSPPAPAPDPGFLRSLRATAVWTLVGALLLFVLGGPTERVIHLLTLVTSTVLAALALRFVAGGRRWPFWRLLVVALPLFAVLYVLQAFALGAALALGAP